MYPRCPKCPYGKDDNVLPSKVQQGKWFCQSCGSYFEKISGMSPPDPALSKLIKLETDENLRWPVEEVAEAKDRPLAQFYARINSDDRKDLERAHIDIHRDFRPEPATIEPYDGTK